MALDRSAHEADPIPEAARVELDRLLASGDLFRYNAPCDAPVTLMEREFAALLGARYALAVASCSAALFLSLKALDLPRGARVLIPAFTFAAVPSAVVHADCVPVLVDCDETYRLDADDLRAKAATADAILVSHMRGHTSDMDLLLELCEARGIPLIEDAAHSLGTLWNGRRIGTLGRVGCFSFQSYKLVNGGEGGILVTDDAELVARAAIMSGAYEHAWKKHAPDADLAAAFGRWQNRLPLYNTRMSNLSAAVIRPQLPEVPYRVAAGRRNHDHLAAMLEASPWMSVPRPLPGEERAPDSIQFNLVGMTDEEVLAFVAAAGAAGVKVQVFGMSEDNARAFWNWQFLPAESGATRADLPKTAAMLMRACDVRMPVRLSLPELDEIGAVLTRAAAEAARAYGT